MTTATMTTSAYSAQTMWKGLAQEVTAARDDTVADHDKNKSRDAEGQPGHEIRNDAETEGGAVTEEIGAVDSPEDDGSSPRGAGPHHRHGRDRAVSRSRARERPPTPGAGTIPPGASGFRPNPRSPQRFQHSGLACRLHETGQRVVEDAHVLDAGRIDEGCHPGEAAL